MWAYTANLNFNQFSSCGCLNAMRCSENKFCSYECSSAFVVNRGAISFLVSNFQNEMKKFAKNFILIYRKLDLLYAINTNSRATTWGNSPTSARSPFAMCSLQITVWLNLDILLQYSSLLSPVLMFWLIRISILGGSESDKLAGQQIIIDRWVKLHLLISAWLIIRCLSCSFNILQSLWIQKNFVIFSKKI